MSEYELLLNAIKTGDIVNVQKLINENPALLYESHEGKPFLNWAAQFNQAEVIKVFFEKVPPSKKTDYCQNEGFAASKIACKFGSLKAFQFLLKSDVDINKRAYKPIAFHLIAIKTEQIAILDWLLTNNPNVITDYLFPRIEIRTLYDTLLKTNNLDVVRLFHRHNWLKLGAESLFHYAAKTGNLEILKFSKEINWDLLTDLNIKGGTLLHNATDVKIAKWLIKEGLDLETRDKEGFTPLMRAVEEKNTSLVQWYHEQKANFSTKDNKNNTLLHIALEHRAFEIIPLLLEHQDIDLNAQNSGRETALHYAARFNTKPEIVKLLIDKKANVLIANNDGNLPWHLAVECLDILKMMYPYVKDINIKNKKGMTALHMAAAKHDKNIEIINWLIINQADVLIPDNEGNLAWHLGVGCLDILKIMYPSYIKDINVKNNLGMTALHLATAESDNDKNIDVVNWLVTNGANVNQTYIYQHDTISYEVSALLLAARPIKQNVHIVHYLLMMGTIVDDSGLTLLKKSYDDYKKNQSNSWLSTSPKPELEGKIIFELLELGQKVHSTNNSIEALRLLNIINNKMENYKNKIFQLNDNCDNDEELSVDEKPQIGAVKEDSDHFFPSLKQIVALKLAFFTVAENYKPNLEQVSTDVIEEYKNISTFFSKSLLDPQKIMSNSYSKIKNSMKAILEFDRSSLGIDFKTDLSDYINYIYHVIIGNIIKPIDSIYKAPNILLQEKIKLLSETLSEAIQFLHEKGINDNNIKKHLHSELKSLNNTPKNDTNKKIENLVKFITSAISKAPQLEPVKSNSNCKVM